MFDSEKPLKYMKRHRELAKPDTLFINLDSVGGDELHWAIGERRLQHIPYPQTGLEALSDMERRSGMAVLPRIPIPHSGSRSY